MALEAELALHVGGEGRPERLIALDKSKRPVIHCAPGEKAVVGVHVALHVADTQPRDRERRLPLGERAHEPEEPLLLRQARVHDPSELAIEGVVDEATELLEGALDVAPGTARPELEVTHADKGGRCAARDRAPLSHQVVWRVVVSTLVVVAVPHALRVLGARGDEAEGACRGHTHGMHRLRDEELTDR